MLIVTLLTLNDTRLFISWHVVEAYSITLLHSSLVISGGYADTYLICLGASFSLIDVGSVTLPTIVFLFISFERL